MQQFFEMPLRVNGTRVWRTYKGGRELNRRDGDRQPQDTNFPEEWMFSTTRGINAGREELVEGICTLTDFPATTLQQAIAENPAAMLGKTHFEKWGANLGVLVKQIDSAERLTVQVHPNHAMAEKLFHSQFGKTECWHILSVREDGPEPPCLYLGFQEGITKAAWQDCFERQDYPAMLALLHRFEVHAGETYLVAGGVPHAIGAGCMLIEVQEPTDYTIRVEKVTPSGQTIAASQCHQGLGFDKMFDCFSYEGLSYAQTKQKWCINPRKTSNGVQLVGYQDTPCFQMQRLRITEQTAMHAAEGYYCLYVLKGSGMLQCGSRKYQMQENTQLFVPAGSAIFRIKPDTNSTLTLLQIYGPQG